MSKDTGIVSIHGKEYKTVASRVNGFRIEFEQQYSLESEIVSIDKDTVVMKAFIRSLVVEGMPVVAVGHAEESRGASTINRTSALENCETSAYGRALAAFGFAGTEFASADEVANAIHQQNAPKVIRNRTEEIAAGPEPMGTESTLDRAKKAINAELIAQNYITSDSKKAFIEKVLEKPTIDSIDDAELVMTQLENER